MAWDFEVIMWKNYDDENFEGKPDNLASTYGVKVEAYDTETRQYDYFWALNAGRKFEDWTEWLDYVASMMSMYGMVME